MRLFPLLIVTIIRRYSLLKKSLTREFHHVQRISILIFSIIFFAAALVIFWDQTLAFQKERILTLNRIIASDLADESILTQILSLQNNGQTAELRNIVTPLIQQNLSSYPNGYTAGYYSSPLDQVIATSSRGRAENLSVKLPQKDPGRKIWITKQPIITTKWSRPDQSFILKCYYPILYKGEVIGHTFAKTDLWAFSRVNRKLLLNLIGILALGIACAFLVEKKATFKIKKNIHRLTLLDPQKKFPPFDYSDFDKVAETNHKVFEDLITTEKAKTELLTNFPWGFCIVNSNGILININNKGLDLLGLKREAVLHRGISALGKEFTGVLRAFHEKAAIETEVVIPAGDSEKKVLLVNAFPLTINAGESGAMACFIDITGQRRMQAMLEHMNRLSIVGEMISIIVHDIRNPLTVMKALAQLCYMKPEVNYRLNCKKIDQLTEDINAYLGKILTFAKPVNENPAVCSVKEMFENVLILLQGKLNGSQVEVESWITDPEPYVYVNQLDFQYALYTLLNNANENINGPGKIGFQVDCANDTVRIIIADSSKGLPEQELSQIWDTVVNVKPKGMNVGLAMCKRLIQKYNGDIIATSKLGHGTIFTIMLPTVKVKAEQPERYVSV
jgi:two-component system sensor histidine kinase AtoS